PGLLAGPRRNGRIQGDDRLLAVHRLLEAGLLLGLEERMVVEGVCVLVMPERHRVLEPRVPFLELQVVLDHFRKERGCFNRHSISWVGGGGRAAGRDCSPSRAFSTVDPSASYGCATGSGAV